MLRLNYGQSLRALLATTAATRNPTASVSYYDVSNQTKVDYSEATGATKNTTLTGVTESEICSSPPQGATRKIDYICVYNEDSSAVTASVILDESGANFIQRKVTLAAEDSLVWTPESGWIVVT